MLNRRQLIGAGAAGAALVSSQAWSKTTNMGLPEAAQMDTAATAITARPSSGPDYNPVVTLNGWTSRDLSRFRAAPSARLSHLSFESDGAFPTQC